MARQVVFSEDLKELQRYIAHLRFVNGLTQENLAALVGMTPKAISDIETNRRRCSLMSLLRIYSALGINFVDVIKKEGNNVKKTNKK